MSTFAVLDCETLAKPEAEIRAALPPFDESAVALGNASKADTVARIIAEARASYGNDIVERAALSPDYGTIAIIGMLERGIHTVQLTGDEATMLRDAWGHLAGLIKDMPVVGFNLKTFDLHFMLHRSWRLDVKVPRVLFNPCKPRWPWHENFVDLLEVYRAGDYQAKSGGLENVLKQFGLPAKTGDGKDFGKLWESDRDAAIAYNTADLWAEHALAERMGL